MKKIKVGEYYLSNGELIKIVEVSNSPSYSNYPIIGRYLDVDDVDGAWKLNGRCGNEVCDEDLKGPISKEKNPEYWL